MLDSEFFQPKGRWNRRQIFPVSFPSRGQCEGALQSAQGSVTTEPQLEPTEGYRGCPCCLFPCPSCTLFSKVLEKLLGHSVSYTECIAIRRKSSSFPDCVVAAGTLSLRYTADHCNGMKEIPPKDSGSSRGSSKS